MLCLKRVILSALVAVFCCGRGQGAFAGDAANAQLEHSPVAKVEYPPEPDFENTVDYLAWFRQRNFQEDWPAGSEVYAWASSPQAGQGFPLPGEEYGKRFGRGAHTPWAVDDWPDMLAHLKSAEPYVDLLRQSVQVENVRWLTETNNRWWWCTLGQPLTPRMSRQLCCAMFTRVWVPSLAKHERAERLLEASRVSLRHANHIQLRTFLDWMVSEAIRAHAYHIVRNAVEVGVVEGADTRRLLAVLREHDLPTSPMEAYCLEWINFLDLMQQLYPAGRFSDAACERLGLASELPPAGLFLPSPQITAKLGSKYYRSMIDAAGKPYLPATLREVEAVDDGREKLIGHNLILSMMLPSLYRSYALALRLEAERRATLLVVALHIYRDEQGSWPAKLDVCALPGLAEVRIDPYSGKDFVYELRDGQPCLYSVGHNGTDDGGKHDSMWGEFKPDRDFVFLPSPDLGQASAATSQPQ